MRTLATGCSNPRALRLLAPAPNDAARVCAACGRNRGGVRAVVSRAARPFISFSQPRRLRTSVWLGGSLISRSIVGPTLRTMTPSRSEFAPNTARAHRGRGTGTLCLIASMSRCSPQSALLRSARTIQYAPEPPVELVPLPL